MPKRKYSCVPIRFADDKDSAAPQAGIKTARQETLKKAHDRGQLVIIAGSAVPPGMPNDEGGPRAWAGHFFADRKLNPARVAQVALLQMATKPSHRPLVNTRHRAVFVFSDAAFPKASREAAAGNECRAIGTLTEADRLVTQIKWIELRAWFTKADIITLAVNEIQLAREDDPELRAKDVLLLLWKASAASFGGAAMLNIGRAICDTAFTLGTVDTPAFMDREDDPGSSQETDE